MRSIAALKMLLHDRSTTAGAVLGVVAIVFLVGQQLSVLFGLFNYMSVLVDHKGETGCPISLIAAQQSKETIEHNFRISPKCDISTITPEWSETNLPSNRTGAGMARRLLRSK